MTRFSRWTLARRVTALVLLGALAVTAVFATLVVVSARSGDALDDLLNRTGPTRRAALDLQTVLVEQQNALRGYALTGDPARLVAYQAGLDLQDRNVETIRDLLPTQGPDTARALDALVATVDRWRGQGAEPMLEAVRTGRPRPPTDPIYQTEATLFSPVLSAATDLDRVLLVRRDAIYQRLAALRTTEIAVLAGAVVMAAMTALSTLLAVRRWVTGPMERLAEDARRVADGDHAHQVGVPDGPPELAAVAGAVERMRSRIIAELATLEARERELREAGDRMRDQAVDLMRSNRDLEQFAYVASHDLQEPLRKVAGFCQLLQRRYSDQLDDKAQQYISFAVDGAQRMQRLINELLAFSRVGRADRALVATSLAEAAAGALDDIETMTGFAEAEITVADLPEVRGDATMLRQLLGNLIGNGVKFRRDGEPARVRVSAEPDPAGWRVAVADDGIGIDPEYADKIFTLFGRLHARSDYPGTGIGLALAERIVEYHGGRIWLDTERRGGTTIRFTLRAIAQEA